MQPPALVLLAALALAPAAASAGDGPFVAAEGPDLWRASTLLGVDVLGPDGRKVGTVADLLMDHAGRASAVVIGVGGLLGVVRKDVALPFAAVHFAADARPAAASGAPGLPAGEGGPPPAPAALGGPVGTTAGVPGGRATGLAATPAAPPGGTAAAAEARTTARPVHATVDVTADQIEAAPAFGFAR